MVERRNVVIKNMHVGRVGISDKTDDHRMDDQSLIKENVGRRTGGKQGRKRNEKPTETEWKFALKMMVQKQATDDVHEEWKRERCWTTQVVKSLTPANGNLHWGADDSLSATREHEGGATHTWRARGLGGWNVKSMQPKFEKEKKRYFGGRSKNAAHDWQS